MRPGTRQEDKKKKKKHFHFIVSLQTFSTLRYVTWTGTDELLFVPEAYVCSHRKGQLEIDTSRPLKRVTDVKL